MSTTGLQHDCRQVKFLASMHLGFVTSSPRASSGSSEPSWYPCVHCRGALGYTPAEESPLLQLVRLMTIRVTVVSTEETVRSSPKDGTEIVMIWGQGVL
eukprot:51231-Eustigmatos_ZCMA.PRE.2